MAHTERLPGVRLRHSVPPVQDCEGRWWSGGQNMLLLNNGIMYKNIMVMINRLGVACIKC